MSYRDEWAVEPDKGGLAKTNEISDVQGRINHMQALIAKGSILSMLNMAHFYEYLGCEFGGPDMASAEKWYKEAVLAGSGIATYEFGRFLIRAKRYEEAIDVLKMGVERDYAPSIVRLSAFYTTRSGGHFDVARGVALLQRASLLGNLRARRALSRIYINADLGFMKKLHGLLLWQVADVQFFVEKRRNATSEKLMG